MLDVHHNTLVLISILVLACLNGLTLQTAGIVEQRLAVLFFVGFQPGIQFGCIVLVRVELVENSVVGQVLIAVIASWHAFLVLVGLIVVPVVPSKCRHNSLQRIGAVDRCLGSNEVGKSLDEHVVGPAVIVRGRSLNLVVP